MIGRRISHYEIVERLGQGGMGEVFRARDLALGRVAALKLLPSHFDAGLRRRLLREADTARRLQHPGIATYFEGGEVGETAFLAMEYVPGETLRGRLRRGALPVPEALTIASGLLEALCHAHAAGIVHRDLKPENVVLTGEGTAKLLDFGIARHAASEEDGALPTLTMMTEPGSAVGTVGYMAPEQLRGEVADPQADLFALGAVLYEMLTGKPAFPGATAAARMSATLFAEPDALHGLPPDVQAVVRHALARPLDQRYASAPEFLRDLRRLAEGQAVADYPDSVAILDFETRSADAADAWIGAGISETLTADLARFTDIEIVPRARVLRALSTNGTRPGALGALLGCRWVLSGSVQKMGRQVRALMQLTHVPTDEVKTTEKVDGSVDDLFVMQDELGRKAAAALDLRDRAATAPVPAAPTLGAYECYTRGQALWVRMTKGGFDQAQDLFEQAVRQQPDYADALAGLAAVHDLRFTFTTDPKELEHARDFARRAVAAAPRHAGAHVWLSYALWRGRDLEGGLEAIRRAAELDVAGHYPPYFQACMLLDRGEPEAALPLYQRAVELATAFGFGWVGLANTHMRLGRYDEAVWSFEKGLELESRGFHSTNGAAGYLGECYRRRGDRERARAECLAGLDSVERTDHMYRDTFRAICLNALGRTALEQGDDAAARTAFHQCRLHLGGRPRTLGGGFLMSQALAGLSATEGDRALLDQARGALARRDAFDWSWLWLCEEDLTRADIARAEARMR